MNKEVKATKPKEALTNKGTRIRSKSKWAQVKAESKKKLLYVEEEEKNYL
jgi:hypothetical protein